LSGNGQSKRKLSENGNECKPLLDGADTLLRALAVFSAHDPAVSGPVVGAVLALALRSREGRAALDAVRAARG